MSRRIDYDAGEIGEVLRSRTDFPAATSRRARRQGGGLTGEQALEPHAQRAAAADRRRERLAADQRLAAQATTGAGALRRPGRARGPRPGAGVRPVPARPLEGTQIRVPRLPTRVTTPTNVEPGTPPPRQSDSVAVGVVAEFGLEEELAGGISSHPRPQREHRGRPAFLVERAKYIRALVSAGYGWWEIPALLNVVNGDHVHEIHKQLDIEGWPPPFGPPPS